MRPFAFATAVVGLVAGLFSVPTHAASACRVKGRYLEVSVETAANNELRAVYNSNVVATLILDSEVKGRIKSSKITDEIIADALKKTIHRTSRAISFGMREMALELQGNGKYGFTIFRQSQHDQYTVDSSNNFIAFAPQCSALEALLGGYAVFMLSQK